MDFTSLDFSKIENYYKRKGFIWIEGIRAIVFDILTKTPETNITYSNVKKSMKDFIRNPSVVEEIERLGNIYAQAMQRNSVSDTLSESDEKRWTAIMGLFNKLQPGNAETNIFEHWTEVQKFFYENELIATGIANELLVSTQGYAYNENITANVNDYMPQNWLSVKTQEDIQTPSIEDCQDIFEQLKQMTNFIYSSLGRLLQFDDTQSGQNFFKETIGRCNTYDYKPIGIGWDTKLITLKDEVNKRRKYVSNLKSSKLIMTTLGLENIALSTSCIKIFCGDGLRALEYLHYSAKGKNIRYKDIRIGMPNNLELLFVSEALKYIVKQIPEFNKSKDIMQDWFYVLPRLIRLYYMSRVDEATTKLLENLKKRVSENLIGPIDEIIANKRVLEPVGNKLLPISTSTPIMGGGESFTFSKLENIILYLQEEGKKFVNKYNISKNLKNMQIGGAFPTPAVKWGTVYPDSTPLTTPEIEKIKKEQLDGLNKSGIKYIPISTQIGIKSEQETALEYQKKLPESNNFSEKYFTMAGFISLVVAQINAGNFSIYDNKQWIEGSDDVKNKLLEQLRIIWKVAVINGDELKKLDNGKLHNVLRSTYEVVDT